ncbi:hypothetical protein LCGC14_3030660, partial [marine sediment metagenome]
MQDERSDAWDRLEHYPPLDELLEEMQSYLSNGKCNEAEKIFSEIVPEINDLNSIDSEFYDERYK